MNHKEVQDIATKHGLGQVHFQFNVAQNTGRQFEVGYVSTTSGRSLFCKRTSNSNPDQFYLCNEYAKLEAMPGRQKSVDKLIQEIAECLAQWDTESIVEVANKTLTTKHRVVDSETVEEMEEIDRTVVVPDAVGNGLHEEVDNDTCSHCGSRHTNELSDTEHECYDCGQIYSKE